MDLLKEINKKETLPRTNRIIKWIGQDKDRFAALVQLFFSGEYRVTQNAAWPMSACIRKYPSLANPYYKKFTDLLPKSDAHPAAKRNIVRFLQFMEIPKRYQGKLMDACFRFISDPKEQIAVKAFSITILANLGKSYPEILPELKTILEARMEFETPAFRSRALKVLAK